MAATAQHAKTGPNRTTRRRSAVAGARGCGRGAGCPGAHARALALGVLLLPPGVAWAQTTQPARPPTASAPSAIAQPAGGAPASAATAAAGAWPLWRGDTQHAGVAAAGLPDRLEVVWKREFTEPIGSTAAIVNGVAYVGCDDGKLRALRLGDGADLWTYETGDPIRASPSLLGDAVYVGNDKGMLHAVDAASGKARWTFETQDQVISAVVPLAGGRIACGSYDALVYCLNAADGALAWKHETAGKVHGTPGVTPDGKHLLVAGCDEYLYVLDAATGDEVTKIAAGSPTGSSPAIAGDRAFVGTYGQQVLGIDWRRGEVLWRFEDPERQFPYAASAAIVLATDAARPAAIVIGGRDKRLRCLDAETGRQRWEFVARGRIDSSPVIVGGPVAIGDGVQAGRDVKMGPRVFVGASDGNLYALSLADGREVWRFEAGGAITASPAVADGRLVIGTEDGVLYCFGAGGR